MSGVKGQRSGGHNAKTVAQHKLAGTYQPCRHAGHESPDPPDGSPTRPKDMDGEAAAEWDRMVWRLEQSGSASVVDDGVLYDYCQVHALAERLQETVDGLESLTFWKVTVDGAGQEHSEPRVHPAVGQLRQARMALRTYLTEFGMTPASRGRVKLPEKPAEKDPFAEFDAAVH